MSKTVLAIVAHADDEVIGCGGTLSNHVLMGDQVHVIVVTAPGMIRQTDDVKQALHKCAEQSGFHYTILDYPDQGLDRVFHLTLNQSLEAIIQCKKPDIIYTHSDADLNLDHVSVHNSVCVAARLVPNLLFFQIPSTGEVKDFKPRVFKSIDWPKKQQLLEIYQCEMRNPPHPRSYIKLQERAGTMGSKANFMYAEGFEAGRITL